MTVATNLHCGEVPDPVKFKDDLHISIDGALIAPANVVITRPYMVFMCLTEIIQA